MSLEHAILGWLNERPMTGYELKNECFDACGHVWTADQSQIYRTLERLRVQKHVIVARHRQKHRPDRRVYTITEAGIAALKAWLLRDEPLPAPRDSFLVRLRFAASLPRDAHLAILSARRRNAQEQLDSLRSRKRTALHAHSRSEPHEALCADDAALEAALARLRHEIDWLDDAIESYARQCVDADPNARGARGSSREDAKGNKGGSP